MRTLIKVFILLKFGVDLWQLNYFYNFVLRSKLNVIAVVYLLFFFIGSCLVKILHHYYHYIYINMKIIITS